jgi:dihydroorotate dehydrogenase
MLSRLRTFLFGSSIAATLYVVYLYGTDTRASIHSWLVPPLMRLVFPDAEDAHHAGVSALKTLYTLGLNPRERPSPTSTDNAMLATTVFGQRLSNPIGISAGLDKDGEIPDALFALGAAVVEVGGCTPRPQAGNPRPRVFRVPGLDALINRYGLNSRGADAMAAALRQRAREFARIHGVSEADLLAGRAGVPRGSLAAGKLLAVQVAKAKDTDGSDVDAISRDYVYCVQRLAPYADILVVNVSSPNTPGLRDLQAVEPLTKILTAVVNGAKSATSGAPAPKVMVKVSPDEEDESQIEGVVRAVWLSGVDGVIVGNTTKRRTGLVPDGARLEPREVRTLAEEGGFSGPAMFGRTLDLVKRYRKMLDGCSLREESASATTVPALDGTVSGKAESPEQKVVFATGGIANGRQALDILNAGASVAMVYTAMVYGGSGTVTEIKREMKKSLEGQGKS